MTTRKGYLFTWFRLKPKSDIDLKKIMKLNVLVNDIYDSLLSIYTDLFIELQETNQYVLHKVINKHKRENILYTINVFNEYELCETLMISINNFITTYIEDVFWNFDEISKDNEITWDDLLNLVIDHIPLEYPYNFEIEFLRGELIVYALLYQDRTKYNTIEFYLNKNKLHKIKPEKTKFLLLKRRDSRWYGIFIEERDYGYRYKTFIPILTGGDSFGNKDLG